MSLSSKIFDFTSGSISFALNPLKPKKMKIVYSNADQTLNTSLLTQTDYTSQTERNMLMSWVLCDTE